MSCRVLSVVLIPSSWDCVSFFVQRLPEQPGPVPSLNQAAKAMTSEKAVGSTLKNETSESGSSDSSDSEEETPVSQTQPALPAGESHVSDQNPLPSSSWFLFLPCKWNHPASC